MDLAKPAAELVARGTHRDLHLHGTGERPGENSRPAQLLARPIAVPRRTEGIEKFFATFMSGRREPVGYRHRPFARLRGASVTDGNVLDNRARTEIIH